MKLIAKITLVTVVNGEKCEIAPGEQVEVKDKAEAASLIARGFAADPAAKPEPEPEPTPEPPAT